jgi:hypothetical protein
MFVKTTNLWHRGKVPARWSKSLPEDAEFRSALAGESVQDCWTYTSTGWQLTHKESIP